MLLPEMIASLGVGFFFLFFAKLEQTCNELYWIRYGVFFFQLIFSALY